MAIVAFESSVNSEGIETTNSQQTTIAVFESSVNSEGIETYKKTDADAFRLRAV